MAEATRRHTDTDERFERPGATFDERRAPDDITDLPKQSWMGVLKRAWREFSDDNVTDWAGAGHHHAGDPEPAEEPGLRGHPVLRRARRRAVVGVGLRRRVHARGVRR